MERARRVIERKAMERERETLRDKMRYNVVDGKKKRYCLKIPPSLPVLILADHNVSFVSSTCRSEVMKYVNGAITATLQ